MENRLLIGISGKKGAGKDEAFNMLRFILTEYRGYRNAVTYKNYEKYLKLNLSETSPFTEVKNMKFADALKEMTAILLNCSREVLESRKFKETPLPSVWSNWYLVSSWDHKIWHESKEAAEAALASVKVNKMITWNVLEEPQTPRKILQRLGTEGIRNVIHHNAWVNVALNRYYDNDHYPCIFTDTRFPNEADAIRKAGGMVIRINRSSEGEIDEHPSETSLDDYQFDHVIENNSDLETLFYKMEHFYSRKISIK